MTNDQMTVVTLEGDLDYEEAQRVRDRLEELRDVHTGVIDLSHVTYIDSRVISVLMQARRAMPPGSTMRIVVGDASMAKLLSLCGVHRVATLHANLDEAKLS